MTLAARPSSWPDHARVVRASLSNSSSCLAGTCLPAAALVGAEPRMIVIREPGQELRRGMTFGARPRRRRRAVLHKACSYDKPLDMPASRRTCRSCHRCVVCSGCRGRQNTSTGFDRLAVSKEGRRVTWCLVTICWPLDPRGQAPSETDRRWSIPRESRRGGTPRRGPGVARRTGDALPHPTAPQGGSNPASVLTLTPGPLRPEIETPRAPNLGGAAQRGAPEVITDGQNTP